MVTFCSFVQDVEGLPKIHGELRLYIARLGMSDFMSGPFTDMLRFAQDIRTCRKM